MLCITFYFVFCLFVSSANERTEQFGSEEADSELEERGDLIQFYNSVYVLKIKSFALRYAHSTIDSKVGLLLCYKNDFFIYLSKVCLV